MNMTIFDREIEALDFADRSKNFNVFSEGQAAKLSGKNIFSNPYAVGTEYNQIWRDGFTSVKIEGQ